MVELFSLLLISIVSIFFRYSDFYVYTLYDTLVTSINFFIIIRVLKYFYKNKMIFQNIRLFIFSLAIVFVSLLAIVGISSFMGYYDNNLNLKLFLRIFIFLYALISFCLIKYCDFKIAKDYTKKYLFCNSMDVILVISLLIIEFLLTPEKLKDRMYIAQIIILLILTTTLLKLYTDKKTDYWYHKKILYTKLYILIKTNKIQEQLKAPLKRVVSKDYILNDCKYIMEKSFIRSYSLNSISKKFFKMCLDAKIDHEKAIEYTSILCCMLMMNLMKRSFDFVIIPTFILNPTQNIFRSIKFRLKNKKEKLK